MIGSKEMRRITTIATTLMPMVALSAGAAFAALVEGNNGGNGLLGTPRADIIHAHGADDLVSALAGRDELHGGYTAQTPSTPTATPTTPSSAALARTASTGATATTTSSAGI